MPVVIKGKQILDALAEIGAPATFAEIVRLLSVHYPDERIVDLVRQVKRAIDAGVRYGYVQNDDMYYHPTNDASEKVNNLNEMAEFDDEPNPIENASEESTAGEEVKSETSIHAAVDAEGVDAESNNDDSRCSCVESEPKIQKASFSEAVIAYSQPNNGMIIAKRNTKSTTTEDLQDQDFDTDASEEDADYAPVQPRRNRRRSQTPARSRASNNASRSRSRKRANSTPRRRPEAGTGNKKRNPSRRRR